MAMTFKPKFYFIQRPSSSNDVGAGFLSSMEDLSFISEISSEDQKLSDQNMSFGALSNDAQEKQLKFKNILGILNKITPQKFHKLMSQLEPEPWDRFYIRLLTELIFIKAVSSSKYVQLYAHVCIDLAKNLSSSAMYCFNSLMLDLCKAGFDAALEITDNDISDVKDIRKWELKRKLVNLFRFVAEMICIEGNELIDPKEVWDTVKRLIDKGNEIHLEFVFNYLFIRAVRSKEDGWPEYVWSTVASIVSGRFRQGSPTSLRLRFMFLELVEMKARGWKPKRSYYLDDMVPVPSESPSCPSDSEILEQIPPSIGY